MTATVAAPATSNTATVIVRGEPVVVPCPSWCTDPHAEQYVFLDDVSHHGDPLHLAAPTYDGADRVLVARLSQWPFAADAKTQQPFLSLDAAGDGECAELGAMAALAFADQLVVHADRIRHMAREIGGLA